MLASVTSTLRAISCSMTQTRSSSHNKKLHFYPLICCWAIVVGYFVYYSVKNADATSPNHDSPHPVKKHSLGAPYGLEPDIGDSFIPSDLLKGNKDLYLIYLLALHNAVSLVELPSHLSVEVSNRCPKLRVKKSPITEHMHSLEIQYPRILKAIADSGRINLSLSLPRRLHIFPEFRPLWMHGEAVQNTSALLPNIADDSTRKIIQLPLFYLVETYAYHVVYCTNKKQGKEDWTGRDGYWKDVADFLTARDRSREPTMGAPDFFRNMGMDFVLIASHPQLGPSRIHPVSVSYLHRATFLKTDFDVAGSMPKDVIVPYYLYDHRPRRGALVDSRARLFPSHFDNTSYTHSKHDTYKELVQKDDFLLFFAGSDNPINGYRTEFLKTLQQIADVGSAIDTDTYTSNVYRVEDEQIYYSLSKLTSEQTATGVAVSISKVAASSVSSWIFGKGEEEERRKSLSEQEYDSLIRRSTFCLILRGDTTSSKRLFSAIEAGCIPVIVADNIRLPFEDIIDYTAFTIRVPECVVGSDNTNNNKSVGGQLRRLLLSLKTIRDGEVSPFASAKTDRVIMKNRTSRLGKMRKALVEARHFLLFDFRHPFRSGTAPSSADTSDLEMISLLNPVTLTFIEILMRREKYCDEMSKQKAALLPPVCELIYGRLKWARDILHKK